MFGPSTSRRGSFITQRIPWTEPTLLNTWVAYDATETDHFRPYYCLNEFAHVYMRGMVKSGTGDIFVLPEGLRPAKKLIFYAPCNGTAGEGAVARVDVKNDGTVLVQGYHNTGTNAWICLDNVHFEAR